jgi:hypothetical protein
MSIPESLTQLKGERRGHSSLWLSPIRYTWEESDKPQQGLLVVQHNARKNVATGAWTDTWHFRDAFMPCLGTIEDGRLSVKGSYAAPTGPDWGWMIVLEPLTPNGLRMLMYNISPEGVSELAVQADYA